MRYSSRIVGGLRRECYVARTKVCASWVPETLSDKKKKKNRMGISLTHLIRYADEENAFLYRIVTGAETPLWTPESKRQIMNDLLLVVMLKSMRHL
ncbi:hypothetical protein AVEN_266497-1 [Araneus ventricosus]|uniref:Uncharacterized protein n=1 Tax=Araneus ventricosus TaxID=182803 RepID=A0A4Y2I375_ARAVE|nr:hypothetical protein AVEN_266497-1 [Araneus ventricosus]